MSKARPELIELECPCCRASLRIDPSTKAVISFKEQERPRTVEDLSTAVKQLKGEPERREQIFQKQMAEQRSHKQVLDRKFEELLKQAKEGPLEPPPQKDIDLD